MSKIKLVDINGNELKQITLSEKLLTDTPHTQAMFDQVIAENAGARQGTHSTLTKGEVRGGGRKPYKQKHTGNARQGSIRNPHWVGGGVVFGPKPNRNYKVAVNSKISKLALKSAIAIKANAGMICAIENKIDITKPSAKIIKTLLDALKISGKKVLIITNETGVCATKITKSANNISKVVAKKWNQVSVKDVLHANYLIAQEEIFAKLEKVVG